MKQSVIKIDKFSFARFYSEDLSTTIKSIHLAQAYSENISLLRKIRVYTEQIILHPDNKLEICSYIL